MDSHCAGRECCILFEEPFKWAKAPRTNLETSPAFLEAKLRLRRLFWHSSHDLRFSASYKPGCYIGQETIAKLVTYDGVKQSLWGIELDGAAAPGTPITVDGQKVRQDSKVGLKGAFRVSWPQLFGNDAHHVEWTLFYLINYFLCPILVFLCDLVLTS